MPPSAFHPLVERWFVDELGPPTPAQRLGWASIAQGRNTLIAAPTGSGKTLAAFLIAIDALFREGLDQPLADEVRVLYVSPLKALSADIHRNLEHPRRRIRHLASTSGLAAPEITAAVRTGDTPAANRTAMLEKPPHILVTTPESLYLLLTSERSRRMLRTVRTVIVDELHAVMGTRRGAHLALSLERLERVAGASPLRIGLSATQKPIADVARWLSGNRSTPCSIVDEGHGRAMDLGIEIPRSELDAVMAHEVWEEYYDRLAELAAQHQTTLVFVNTRHMAERLARHLSDRLGESVVAAHHGSLSKESRLDAETRLKNGALRVLVATASLELGIDIGHVDLVCQIGSPRKISTLLQRIGRSGHTVAGTPKGRVFPVSRDDLLECAALFRAVRRGELDAIVQHEAPLDVLAQQLVAEAASTDAESVGEDELFELCRRAWPYRDLDRTAFDAVVAMAAQGFTTRRGRRAALLHRDEVHATVRGRRGARLLAQTCGGAIPDVADYRVIMDPGDTFVGTLNEDFAIESNAGDIFQLGNTSWRILQVTPGVVRVSDAKGAPPTIPFWLGEAPARSDELSRAVSDLRALAAQRLATSSGADSARDDVSWMVSETALTEDASRQLLDYLGWGRLALKAMPTQDTLVLERFFDESGGMQLVLHAPFGSRINKAWCLALRKRFCRQFNFELQAAATDDALLLSLGPQHSFPLADVFRYLHPETARDVLVQALLDAPVFKTRWRWNATISLAVPRARGSRRVPAQLQRMLADDLLAAAFPDAAACLENIPGDRQLPDHPLVNQTIHDCLQEAMDFDGLRRVLERIHRGELRLVARDTPEPSVFAYDILNAKPYAFLDDAPLEERRVHAVQTRRARDLSADETGALDATAIEHVRAEARPDPRDAEELHDALATYGALAEEELERLDPAWIGNLIADGRATRVRVAAPSWLFVAAERLPEILAVHPGAPLDPPIAVPPSRAASRWTPASAVTELVRGRLAMSGPVRASDLARTLGVSEDLITDGLLALESEGVVLRGSFIPHASVTRVSVGEARASVRETGASSAAASNDWCDRALLARIHRYTLNRLRAEIEPVTPADFMRFLFTWQHVEPTSRLNGRDGLREGIELLNGFELPAAAWERGVLPSRMDRYDPAMLDVLCLSGEVGWGRLSAPGVLKIASVTPVALFLREHADLWQALRPPTDTGVMLTSDAQVVLDVLVARGASFFRDLSGAVPFDADRLRHALGVLVATGLIASDGFAGLRILMAAAHGRPATENRTANLAGRWSVVQAEDAGALRDAAVECQAHTLLRRYGIVFRRLLTREANAAPWRDLVRIYRRLEARGEVRGGRFVSGMTGEQFALPDAVSRLREVRRTPTKGALWTICTADPLNLAGIVTSGPRVRAAGRNRLAYRDDGVPLAVVENHEIRSLTTLGESERSNVERVLGRRRRVHVM